MAGDTGNPVPPPSAEDVDLAVGLLSQIEERVSDGSVVDALAKLQDLIRDFAKDLAPDALALRQRYELWRRQARTKTSGGDNLNDIRAAVLDLAYAAEQQARAAMTPQQRARLEENAAPTRDPDRAPVAAPTADQMLKRHFQQVWRKDESLIADVAGVRKGFKKGAFSLEPVSFKLRVGEITGVAGRNASGKTTLLRILMGELKPDDGKVTFPGLSLEGGDWAQIKRQIAYVPQLPDRWHGTLRHNLNFIAAVHAKPGQDVRELVDWCVARYELQRYEHATWDEISGGYKIRFELVRALVSQPRLLLLDEPLAYLDVIARQRFLNDLRTIASALTDPIPVVVTSQHLNEVEAVADQMILLDNGECRYAGPLSGIAAKAEYRYVEVSLEAGREEAALALDGLGLVHTESTMEGFIFSFPKSVDLGQVFLRLHAAFGGRFSAIRDITGSARSLMSETVT